MWAAAARGSTVGYLSSIVFTGGPEEEVHRGLRAFVELDLLVIDNLLLERGLENLPLLVELLQARGPRPTVLVGLGALGAMPAWFSDAVHELSLPVASHRQPIRYS